MIDTNMADMLLVGRITAVNHARLAKLDSFAMPCFFVCLQHPASWLHHVQLIVPHLRHSRSGCLELVIKNVQQR